LPGGATVRLDGRPATLPLSVPHGTRHSLSIEAKGYEPWERSIDGVADQTIAVELKEKAPAPGSPSSQKQRSKHRHGSSAFGGFSDL
jgi:hypothetical protein